MMQQFSKWYRESLSIEDFMIQGYHLIQANKEFFTKLVYFISKSLPSLDERLFVYFTFFNFDKSYT